MTWTSIRKTTIFQSFRTISTPWNHILTRLQCASTTLGIMQRTLKKTDQKGLASKSIIEIIAHIGEIPDRYRNAVRNNGGGMALNIDNGKSKDWSARSQYIIELQWGYPHSSNCKIIFQFVNHNLYWSVMMPNIEEGAENSLQPYFHNDLENDFGGFIEFQQNFTREAAKLFGSGYVWLSRRSGDNQLVVTTTANQDSPLSRGLVPILVLDVWEHAYYLKHQNRRLEHVSDWWKLVNWTAVQELDIWWQKRHHHDNHNEL